MPPFEDIWNTIIENQGNIFNTITGQELTYEIHGNYFICNRVQYNIGKRDFEQAYNIWPVIGPGIFPPNINGRSYIWAVLNDERIINVL